MQAPYQTMAPRHPYRYGLVDLKVTDVSRPDPTKLGIEVTDPNAASLCGLGNIDPQHGQSASAMSKAAIEVCLECSLPPEGTCLVTIRPDLDSVGAMALLSIRARGITAAGDLRARVELIAAIDRFDRGLWPGPKPLPATEADLASDWPGQDLSCLAACVADQSVSIEKRVLAVEDWLINGEVPTHYIDQVLGRYAELIRSLRHDTTRVTSALNGRLAVVVSPHAGALALGYRISNTVVALNPAFRFPDGAVGRKYTLARWAEGDSALDRAVTALSQFEKGWGGQHGIKGSPQRFPSKIELDRVVRAMRKTFE